MIKEDGSKATLEEFFEAYEKNKITPSQLKKLKSNIDEGETGDWFRDGPPCFQALAKFGVEKKVRNETLVDMSKYIKMRYPEEWKDKMGEYNKKFFEPIGKGLSYDEVKGVIGSREKKDYAYRCSSDWLKPHCNREQCILRKFGIGGAATNELVLGPLSYVKSTPKIWYLGFNGEEVRLYSKELVKQDLAREAATEQTSKTPPKIKNWDLQVRNLQVKATPIDAPEESQPILRLKSYLEIFCFNLRQTTKKKQLLYNRPYHEAGKVRFIFDGFFKYLKTHDWNIGEDLTHQMLKKLKGISREKFHIEGNNKRWVYVLDSDSFNKEEIEQDEVDFGQNTEAPY